MGRGHRTPASSVHPHAGHTGASNPADCPGAHPLAPPRPALPQTPPARWPVGGALVGGKLVALAVQVGKLSIGAEVKRNLLLQVPGRGGQTVKGQLGTPLPRSGQHREAHSSNGGPLGGWARAPHRLGTLPAGATAAPAGVASATPHYRLLRGAARRVETWPCCSLTPAPLT